MSEREDIVNEREMTRHASREMLIVYICGERCLMHDNEGMGICRDEDTTSILERRRISS